MPEARSLRDASPVRADVARESLAVRPSRPSPRRMATRMATRRPMRARRAAVSEKAGRFGKVCLADPDASRAASGRTRRLEPSGASSTAWWTTSAGPSSPLEVATGEADEGQVALERLDAAAAPTGAPIAIATANAGHARAKAFAGPGGARDHRRRPPEGRTDPLEGPAPALRCDAKHDRLKGPRGRTSQPDQTKVGHGRSFASKARAKARDCKGCDLAALCLSPSRALEAVVVAHDHPAPPRARRRRARRRRARRRRARRRRERRGEDDDRLHRRHRWRSEGLPRRGQDPGRGLSRAARRALDTMRIQALLTAAAINLERLAAALLALTCALLGLQSGPTRARVANRAPSAHDRVTITFGA